MMMKPIIRYEVSNLVGDSTQAKKSFGRGASKRACNIGRAKAPVFPEPVWASPITSLPKRDNSEKIISNSIEEYIEVKMGNYLKE